jgi:hypothetical protein
MLVFSGLEFAVKGSKISTSERSLKMGTTPNTPRTPEWLKRLREAQKQGKRPGLIFSKIRGRRHVAGEPKEKEQKQEEKQEQ